MLGSDPAERYRTYNDCTFGSWFLERLSTARSFARTELTRTDPRTDSLARHRTRKRAERRYRPL